MQSKLPPVIMLSSNPPQRPKTAELVASRPVQSTLNRNPAPKPLLRRRSDEDLKAPVVDDKDQRLKYLLKFAKIISYTDNYSTLFAELPQIPGVWIFYRKDVIRNKNPES